MASNTISVKKLLSSLPKPLQELVEPLPMSLVGWEVREGLEALARMEPGIVGEAYKAFKSGAKVSKSDKVYKAYQMIRQVINNYGFYNYSD